jgi:hypothetical protein
MFKIKDVFVVVVVVDFSIQHTSSSVASDDPGCFCFRKFVQDVDQLIDRRRNVPLAHVVGHEPNGTFLLQTFFWKNKAIF